MRAGDTGLRKLAAEPGVRLAAFAVVVAGVAGVAALAGRASGVGVEDARTDADAMGHAASSPEGTAASAFGISDVSDGFRLSISPTTLAAGAATRLNVRITDAAGDPVTDLDEAHDEPPLHVILVRRDLTGYQHLHPTRSGDGFETSVTLPEPGVWRAYADFEVDGEKVVLGRDLLVPGEFTPRALPAPAKTFEVDGYELSLSHEPLLAEKEAALSFTITRGGEPVELEPYLGADGHLVAVREADLTYLHVHPLDAAEPGRVAFDAEFAEGGSYVLFVQFKDRGEVRTGRFTVEVRP